MVYEEGVKVSKLSGNTFLIEVEFTPTVSHCNLATLIGEEKSEILQTYLVGKSFVYLC